MKMNMCMCTARGWTFHKQDLYSGGLGIKFLWLRHCSLHVIVCIYMCVLCVYTYVCIVCVHVYMCVCMFVCVHACVFIRM